MKRCICALVLIFAILLSPALTVRAEEEPVQARDITQEATITVEGFGYHDFLFDKNLSACYASESNVTFTIEHPEGIASLYMIFDWEYGPYTVTDNGTGQVHTAGTYRFLHEFLDLEAAFGAAPTSITVAFESGSVDIGELVVFTSGQVPEYVQKWAPPLDGGADILMLPTHGDDDQLYFAGLLPYYAGELDLRVQVVYMTSHRNSTMVRTHEMLNGLWAVGVEAYPVFGEYIDFRIDSLKESYRVYEGRGITRDDIVGFMTEQVRRFKPLVAIGHDVRGEYGHGMHQIYSDVLMAAVEISMDPTAYPESAETWGVWDVPKTYLHLLKDNPIVLDYDIPLEHFDGLTAFQVSQKLGFPCHKSQQGYGFKAWLNGYNGEFTSVTQIKDFNPAHFGLYRTTIGPDVEKNDFLENIVTYEEQERLEAERLEQERLEAERLEQERLEAERKEQERLEAERKEQERLEKERLEAEKRKQEQERLEAERLAQEQAKAKKQLIFAVILLVVLVIALAFVLYTALVRSRRKKVAKKS